MEDVRTAFLGALPTFDVSLRSRRVLSLNTSRGIAIVHLLMVLWLCQHCFIRVLIYPFNLHSTRFHLSFLYRSNAHYEQNYAKNIFVQNFAHSFLFQRTSFSFYGENCEDEFNFFLKKFIVINNIRSNILLLFVALLMFSLSSSRFFL